MKKFLKEFKEFAMRGNVLDMAIGVIIGSAFTALVTSFVNDIVSPLIGLIFKMDFSALVVNVRGVDIKYGSVLTAVINFIILAFVVFCFIKLLTKLMSHGKKKEEAAPTTKKCPYCCSEIDIKAIKCPHCASELKAEK